MTFKTTFTPNHIIVGLLACVSMLALSGCSTTNTDRYAFWRNDSSSAEKPDLRNMPNNAGGDNQARTQLNGLQQELMADHAAAIAALQNQGAPTVSVLSSAQDIVPVTTNKVIEKPLPSPKAAQPAVAPVKTAFIAPSQPKISKTYSSGQPVLPQNIEPLRSPQETYNTTLITPPKPAFVPPVPTIVNKPKTYAPAMPAPIMAPAPLPTAPTISTQSLPKSPKPLPAPLPEKLPPIVADAPLPPPIMPSVTPATPPTSAQNISAPAPIAETVTDSSVDINLDALDSFAAPVALTAPTTPAPQPTIRQNVRPEMAAAAQPYAYGYSNYAIKRDLFNTNQGQPMPQDDSVLINPIWEAAPTAGAFGQPLDMATDNSLSGYNAPVTGGLIGQVPFAHSAKTLGPQGRAAVEKLAASWQRTPNKMSVVGFASGLGTATANQNLANARAHAVKQQLIRLGVPSADIRLAANPTIQSQAPRVDVFTDSN